VSENKSKGRRLLAVALTFSAVAVLIAVALAGFGLQTTTSEGQALETVNSTAPTNYTYFTNVTYHSSVDGKALTYLEWLPRNFAEGTTYPLAVFLHGLGYNGSELYVLSGGKSAIKAAWTDDFLLISVNTRTGSGFYTNSAYTGPQQQDVIDAIHHEESIRKVGKLYLFGSSMGTIGSYAIAAQYPGMVSGVGGAANCMETFEAVYWHYLEIPSGYQSFLSITGGKGPGNASFTDVLYNMSAVRFYPQNYSGIMLYAAQGGNDPDCPDNGERFDYLQANNTFLNSTCQVVAAWGEPANCEVPFSNLSELYPSEYKWRFAYESTAGHTLNDLNGADMFSFWMGKEPTGLVCAKSGGTPASCPV
jgi:pimeloyl-ACP methyl ester carboxylesterase